VSDPDPEPNPEPEPPAPSGRWLVLLALIAFALGTGIWLSKRSNKGDLEVYHRVLRRVGQGQDLYHYREGPDPERPTAYIYPPTFAPLFYPLTRLDFSLLRALWGALSVLLAARCLWLGWRLAWAGRPPPASGRSALLFLLGALVSIRFVWSDIGHGQVNLLVAWLTLEGIAAAEQEGQEERAGAWLAAAVVLKLTPAIVVALYLARGRWKLFGWCALWGLLLLWLPALVWGPSQNADYLWRFATQVTPWNAEFHACVGNNVSLPAAILRLLVGSGDAGTAPQPFLLGLPKESVRPWLSLVSLGFLGGTLAMARRRPLTLALGLALTATPLISPVAWKPHLVVLILPGLLAARLLLRPSAAPPRRQRWALGALGLGALLVVATGRFPLGRTGAELALRWGLTSLGLLSLWVGFALWPPDDLSQELPSPGGPQAVSSET
jgi:glycosyl transferase family 87